MPVFENFECVESVRYYSEEYGRYRQAIFKAVTPDCRAQLTRLAIDETGAEDSTKTWTFDVVVWPERVPDFIGSLYDLDEGDRTINALGEQQFTVRINEQATETGYAWNAPEYEF